MNGKSKNIQMIIIAVLVLIVLIGILIGNYFVNYALVNEGESDNRQELVEEHEDNEEDEPDEAMDSVIERNRQRSHALNDKWLEQVEDHIEEVSIQSDDQLTLKANAFIHDNDDHDWVIVVHGYKADRHSMLAAARHYFENGQNVLIIDHRAHGDSEGKYITMGIKEKYDLLNWIDFIIERDPEAHIVLHGESMGAATVLLASGLSNLPESVSHIIADCGYSGVWEIFESELKARFNLPAFPVLHFSALVALPRVNINLFSDGNVLEAVSQSNTPTLIIHGTDDDFVPFEMGEQIYQTIHTAQKSFYSVEDAGHAEAQYVDQEAYYSEVFDFISGF